MKLGHVDLTRPELIHTETKYFVITEYCHDQSLWTFCRIDIEMSCGGHISLWGRPFPVHREVGLAIWQFHQYLVSNAHVKQRVVIGIPRSIPHDHEL